MYFKFINADQRVAFSQEQLDDSWTEFPDEAHAALFAEITAAHPVPKIIALGTDGLPAVQDVIKNLAELKQAKRHEINAIFEQAMQQITSGYPANEVSSWAKQETEARAYVANNSAATPLIDALASSRSVNKAELVTRIIAKADLFAGISGTLIGHRQGLEDTLDALPETATAEEIATISW